MSQRTKEEVEGEMLEKLKSMKGEMIEALVETLLSDNPGILKPLNRFFLRQSIKMGIILSLLISGVFGVVNVANARFGLTYELWLIAGALGAFLTLRAYLKG